jgi:hypothetical protein
VKKGTQTCDEDTSGEYAQIRWASIGAIQIRRDRTRPVSTRVVPEPFCESVATFHQKDHITLLLLSLCPVNLVGNAGDGEWVGFEWEVANGGENDIGMLAWGPREVTALERHENGIFREELNGGKRLRWVALATECTVVPDNTSESDEAVEAPNKEGRPDVGPIAD